MAKSVILWLLIFPFKLTMIGQQIQLAQSNQQWLQNYTQISIGQKWSQNFDAGIRWRNNFSELIQFIARANTTYQINSKFKIGLGYAQSQLYSNAKLTCSEYRPFQEAIVEIKSDKYFLGNRIRLEQRFFNDFSGDMNPTSRFALRGRYNFSFSHYMFKPFSKYKQTQVWFTVGNEIFVNLSSNNKSQLFDQNRFFVGPVLKLNNKLSIQFIYNMQVSKDIQQQTFRLMHVTWISLKQTISWKDLK